MVAKDTILRDLLFFLKNDFNSNITDPISAKRSSKSRFVMTSYPVRPVQYPIITIKCTNIVATRAGMQTTSQDITLDIEIRVWGRNQKEKDEISTDVFNRLSDIQFTAGTGSVANNLHDFFVGSGIEIDEPGGPGGQVIKSRVLAIQYKFFNV